MSSNILYHSLEQGAIICIDAQHVDVLAMLRNNSYPLLLQRSARTRFVLLANSATGPTRLPQLHTKQPWSWQEKAIIRIFREALGYKVAPSLYKNQFYIVGKKAKFQFLLQYGNKTALLSPPK